MKRIIELPDKVVEAIQNGEDYRYDIHTAIAQSTPYNPSGDLISRYDVVIALNEAQIEGTPEYRGLGKAKQIIDDLQAVEPERTQGDAISRSALKAELEVYRHDETRYVSDEEEAQNALLDNILEDIDNAPTVDLWQMRQEATENALKKAEVLYDRPKGKWIIVKDEKYGNNVKCPFCGKELAGTDLNFCCKCGADMRKGGAE